MKTTKCGSPSAASHEHWARLECGSNVVYASSSFVPPLGQEVPCVRHNYCLVTESYPGSDEWANDFSHGSHTSKLDEYLDRRNQRNTWPRRRTTLINNLDPDYPTSFNTLRRNGITLRWLVAAEIEGLVALDLDRGEVRLTKRDNLGRSRD